MKKIKIIDICVERKKMHSMVQSMVCELRRTRHVGWKTKILKEHISRTFLKGSFYRKRTNKQVFNSISCL